jgi:hypothetical protein
MDSNINVIASVTMGVLSSIGFILYFLVVVVILSHPKKYAKKNFYYTMLLSLAASDMAMLAISLFYAVPCVYLQSHIFGDSFDSILGAFDIMVYYAGLISTVFIAFNRYWAVCKFQTFRKASDSNIAWKFAVFSWFIGVLGGVAFFFPCCTVHYYLFAYNFLPDITLPGAIYSTWVDRITSLTAVVCFVFCYSAIILQWRKNITSSTAGGIENASKAKLERNLALQFGIVVLALLLNGICYTVVPRVTENEYCSLLVILSNIAYYSCNPVVYLILNSEIREDFKKLLRCNQSKIISIATAKGSHASLASLATAPQSNNASRRLTITVA